jgi:transmembrane sensor
MDSDKTDIEKLIEDNSFRNWVLRSNQEDFEKWEMLLNRDTALGQTAEDAKAIVLLAELAGEGVSEEENKDAWLRLTDKIAMNEAPVQKTEAPLMKRTYLQQWKRYAAVLLLLAAVSVPVYYAISSYSTKGRAAKVPEIERHTQSGQFLTLQLPDGSKIRLNSNSSVKLPEYFVDERVVRLSGEAFFEVARNPRMPFKVITENFTVEVTGTSFNINSYKDQPSKISVESGTVNVNINEHENSLMSLSKHQAAAFDAAKNQLVHATFNADEFLWKDGILTFRDDDIRAIAMKLEHWYGVTIKVSDAEKITGEFNGTYEKEGLENILDGVSYVLNFSYRIDRTKNEIIITPN